MLMKQSRLSGSPPAARQQMRAHGWSDSVQRRRARIRMSILNEQNEIGGGFKWNDCNDQVRKGIAEIGRANVDKVRGYRTLGEAGKKRDLPGAKMGELIALAVTASVRCDICFVVQAAREAAFQNSATEERSSKFFFFLERRMYQWQTNVRILPARLLS